MPTQLQEQIAETLKNDGGWMSSGAIFNRVDVDDRQRLVDELNAMEKRQELQLRTGAHGLEYALPDTPAPLIQASPASSAVKQLAVDSVGEEIKALLRPPAVFAKVAPTPPADKKAAAPARPVEPAPLPAQPKESPMSKIKPPKKPGETRERIRAVWETDREQTAAQIAVKVNMTPAGVAYHLTALREEAGAKAGKTSAAPAKRAKGVTPDKSDSSARIDIELQRITARFAPVSRLSEKVAVLDQLADSISGPVGALLGEIRGDLVRVSA